MSPTLIPRITFHCSTNYYKGGDARDRRLLMNRLHWGTFKQDTALDFVQWNSIYKILPGISAEFIFMYQSNSSSATPKVSQPLLSTK